MDSLIGKTLAGRYRIEKLLGSGGMGAVYAARQLDGDVVVAIKVIPDGDATTVKRFQKEAKTMTRLRHENVVRILSFGRADGVIFLVMELLEGKPLSRLLEKHHYLPPAVAVDIAMQVAAALHAAHKEDVVHRDIKPGNIFLINQDGRLTVKVLDFGIAKTLADPTETKLTRDGSLVGTPLYMAPEQIKNEPLDARTDIYSLSCVLYEMLTGAPPFPSNSMAEILVAHLTEKPPLVSKKVDAERLKLIPPTLDEAMGRALSKDPKLRHGSMREFVNELSFAFGQMPASKAWSPDLESEDDRQELATAETREARTPHSSPGRTSPENGVERARATVGKRKSLFTAPVIGGALLTSALVGLIIVSVQLSENAERERAAAGRVCAVEGLMECVPNEDGTSNIEICRGGKFAQLRTCALTEPCQTDSHSASCGVVEVPVALIGGPCATSGEAVCDLAHQHVIECQFGTWASIRSCAPRACIAVGEDVRCEDNVYSEGDPCKFPDEAFVCSADGASVLACKNGKTVVQHSCGEFEKRCVEVVENGDPVVLCVDDGSADEVDAGP